MGKLLEKESRGHREWQKICQNMMPVWHMRKEKGKDILDRKKPIV